MIIQILLFNIFDFAVYIFGVLAFFSTGLLFFDSWKLNKNKTTPLIRSIGFVLLSIVYMVYASRIESGEIALPAQLLKIISLSLILFSIIKEPILHKPGTKLAVFTFPFILPALSQALIPLSAALLFMISFWYFRRSTKGLDRQLKPAAVAFFFLAVAETVRAVLLWSNTTNVFWSKALAEHSFIWNLHVTFQLIGIAILAFWAWGYIRFRLQIQLFTTILASVFVIFLVTTCFFSFILLKNLENDALSHLKTDANVFQYALDRLQLEALSHAKALAADSGLKEALLVNDTDKLYKITSQVLVSQNLATLTVSSVSGEVLMRAEDKDAIGDSLAEDPLVMSAAGGKQLSTLVLNERPIISEVFIKSAVPVVDTGTQKPIGIVAAGFIVDEAFVDGVKDVTGLDVTVFAGNKRAATTLVGSDGKSRFSGTLETDSKVLKRVLNDKDIYLGALNVLNIPYYAAYAPLKTYGGETIGMLFIGKPQTELLNTAQQSINFTFLGSVLLMVFAIGPVFFISRYMEEQLEA